MKLINLKVTPSAKKNEIKVVIPDRFAVLVKAKPQKGAANEAVRALVAGYFKVNLDQVQIIRGRLSTHKVVGVMV